MARAVDPSACLASRCARALAAVVLVACCGTVAAADLTVAAAASLADAFQEIGRAFEANHPDTKVRFNFAASGQLLQQIAKGAPVGVFASADEETMDRAGQQRLLKPGSRVDFARNTLVVVVPADRPSPKTLAELASPAVRQVAIGSPASVPVGRYAKRALEKAGLWSRIEAKTVGVQSVRQALDYVARGEVDAGFVYATDAALMPAKVRIAFAVPTEPPVRYALAALVDAPAPAAADAFVAFVVSPTAQAVLARHGFAKP